MHTESVNFATVPPCKRPAQDFKIDLPKSLATQGITCKFIFLTSGGSVEAEIEILN